LGTGNGSFLSDLTSGYTTLLDTNKEHIMDTTITVKGMSCNHCVMAVKKALLEVEGVTEAEVDLQKAQATLVHDKPVDMAAIRDRLDRAGYEVG
jgi:copper chaperone